MDCGTSYSVLGFGTIVGIVMVGVMLFIDMKRCRWLEGEVKRLASSKPTQPLETQGPARRPHSDDVMS